MRMYWKSSDGKRVPIDGSPRSRMKLYIFFAIHMLIFGLSGFFMAYAPDDPTVWFLYVHGGFAIVIYLVFYHAIFGRDQVKWMLINAGLGILGIYSQIGWILEQFGKNIDAYPWYLHVIPFLYYVLYTFLLRRFVVDVTGSRDKSARRTWVEGGYVVVSLLVYGWPLLLRFFHA